MDLSRTSWSYVQKSTQEGRLKKVVTTVTGFVFHIAFVVASAPSAAPSGNNG